MTSVTQTCEVGEEKDEVEQTITLCHITVPMIQAGQSTEPCRSGHTSYVPGYYRQLAHKGEDAEHLDFTFAAKHGDMIADAISNLNNDPMSIAEAQS